MVPIHPLRMSARAIAARAGAASAVFMTLAVVLLTGSQIANASGGPPDEGDVHTTHPAVSYTHLTLPTTPYV